MSLELKRYCECRFVMVFRCVETDLPYCSRCKKLIKEIMDDEDRMISLRKVKTKMGLQ